MPTPQLRYVLRNCFCFEVSLQAADVRLYPNGKGRYMDARQWPFLYIFFILKLPLLKFLAVPLFNKGAHRIKIWETKELCCTLPKAQEFSFQLASSHCQNSMKHGRYSFNSLHDGSNTFTWRVTTTLETCLHTKIIVQCSYVAFTP